MIKPGLFTVRLKDVKCNGCNGKLQKTADASDTEWGDAIQNFMDGHKETCHVDDNKDDIS